MPLQQRYVVLNTQKFPPDFVRFGNAFRTDSSSVHKKN